MAGLNQSFNFVTLSFLLLQFRIPRIFSPWCYWKSVRCSSITSWMLSLKNLTLQNLRNNFICSTEDIQWYNLQYLRIEKLVMLEECFLIMLNVLIHWMMHCLQNLQNRSEKCSELSLSSVSQAVQINCILCYF